MGLRTLVLYLLGNRAAILQVAATKHALWLGLLFVLSAGFAREYDGEDLLHEPWHLLIPLGASLATSTLLFAVIWIVFHGWRTFPRGKYAEFLTLYWMTAPLAWIYAIPVERFLDARTAMIVNLCLLAIVSVWRVVLIIRVISVLFDTSMLRVAWPVTLFADSLLIVIIASTPNLLVIMGGVRTDTSEGVLRATATFVGISGYMCWWIWALTTTITFFVNFDRSAPENGTAHPQAAPPTQRVWRLAVGALLIWIVILPFTQPQQWRRYYAERLADDGNYPELIAYLSKYSASKFPPHWDPPPREDSEVRGYELMAVSAAFERLPDARDVPWIWAAYETKFADEFMDYYPLWESLSPADQQRTKHLLSHLGDEDRRNDSEQTEIQLRELRKSYRQFLQNRMRPDLLERINQFR